MTKLTDTQLVLLSTAAQNDGGSLLPLAASLTASRPAIDKSIASLIKRSFAEEGKVTDASIAWRSDGDLNLGVRVTEDGRKAMGWSEEPVRAATSAAPQVAIEKKPTKGALVVALLQREQGATLVEMVAATGWLPHTTRAAMTGLRKKGHDIAKGKRGETTCYSIAVAA